MICSSSNVSCSCVTSTLPYHGRVSLSEHGGEVSLVEPVDGIEERHRIVHMDEYGNIQIGARIPDGVEAQIVRQIGFPSGFRHINPRSL